MAAPVAPPTIAPIAAPRPPPTAPPIMAPAAPPKIAPPGLVRPHPALASQAQWPEKLKPLELDALCSPLFPVFHSKLRQNQGAGCFPAGSTHNRPPSAANNAQLVKTNGITSAQKLRLRLRSFLFQRSLGQLCPICWKNSDVELGQQSRRQRASRAVNCSHEIGGAIRCESLQAL
jgi:hypothetical protein